MKVGRTMFIPLTVLALAILGGAVALVCVYFAGRSSVRDAPSSGYREVSCPSENTELTPQVSLRVRNNVPRQSPETVRQLQEAEECWLLGIYQASCVQSNGQHHVDMRWHEEDDTQQSLVRYYDIYNGNSYLRWTKSGNPHCEHHDYQAFSIFSLALNNSHKVRLEQVDMRGGQPGQIVNYSEVDFLHPT